MVYGILYILVRKPRVSMYRDGSVSYPGIITLTDGARGTIGATWQDRGTIGAT